MLATYDDMDEAALRTEARCHYGACDDGDLDPDDLRWFLIPDMPLHIVEGCLSEGNAKKPSDRIGQWTAWFSSECSMLDEEFGDSSRWDVLAREPVLEPIVVTVEPHRVQIWDGWHRTAASFAASRASIPAIVGVRPVDFGRDLKDLRPDASAAMNGPDRQERASAARMPDTHGEAS